MAVVIRILPRITRTRKEIMLFFVGALVDAVTALNVQKVQSVFYHSVGPESSNRCGSAFAAHAARANKLPIFSGMLTEPDTIFAIIVFYHCFPFLPFLLI